MVGDKFYPADKPTLDKIYDILVGYDDDVYGFIEHMSTLVSSERIEYIGRNKNYRPMSVNLEGDHLANYGDWHDFFFLRENKPFMVKADGEADYELSSIDYTKKADGTTASDVANTSYTGGAFSWLPKIYTYQYIVGDDRYVYFSRIKKNDNYEAIGFINEDDEELRGLWMPMFYGTEITQNSIVKIMSLATGKPSQNRTTDEQKSYIDNFSSLAKFYGGPIVNVLADLLVMLGKNSDIQAVFGTGNCSAGSGADYMKTNACLNGGQFYGTNNNTSLNKAFHSLIPLTQNSYQRDPYTLLVTGALKVSPYYKYDLTGSTYQSTGITYTATSSAWEYPHKMLQVPHFGAVPDLGPYSGSTTTGCADGFYKNITSTRVAFRFATCAHGRAGGPRCLHLHTAAGSTYWPFGASALLLPQAGYSPYVA